jgi:hypothetical protein
MIKLRELKSRKARFGFEYGCLRISDVIPLAEFLTALYNTHEDDQYILEESGYNQPSVKLYTDSEDVASWIRVNTQPPF